MLYYSSDHHTIEIFSEDAWLYFIDPCNWNIASGFTVQYLDSYFHSNLVLRGFVFRWWHLCFRFWIGGSFFLFLDLGDVDCFNLEEKFGGKCWIGWVD